ncbi:MAG: cysteine desulfurase [candidate division Zixibacteria bacterium]|nr:cysteine desulfurase [candidate division Zixibacteria bacterium]
MKRRVYFDHNATTPLAPEVWQAMGEVVSNFGNPSSIHAFGREVKVALESAREKVAHFIGARPSEIIFTSGGTEADNLALFGVAHAFAHRGRHIIISQIEHHAVLESAHQLEKQGFEVTRLASTREGIVLPEELMKALRPDTILVSIMAANNETGTIQPIAELAKIARERGVLFHTDAVQIAGKRPINVAELGVDLLSISAHKLYGPKGVGALWVRRGVKLNPILVGGGHEQNRRAGTENFISIIGFARACELAVARMETDEKKFLALSEKLQAGLKEKVEDFRINGSLERRLPNTLNISFPGLDGEAIIVGLDMEGVAVASGSACTSGATEPSHVLVALGLSEREALGSIRVSLGRDNTEEDVDYFLAVLPPIVERLKALSKEVVEAK